MIGAHKLTIDDVKDIKELFRLTTLSDGAIGALFNVSRGHIQAIRTGRRWNDEERSFMMKEQIDPSGIINKTDKKRIKSIIIEYYDDEEL